MSIRLGQIVVDLTANTVSFSQGMDKASQIALNSSKNIQRSLNMVSVSAAAMASSIIGSFTIAIDKAQNFAFQIQKSAQQVGSSSEMFSKLAYNAKLVGTPMETLSMAMMRMARTSTAAQAGTKESIGAYAALGITVKMLQGPLKDSGNLFVAVAKGLDKYADSSAKTGLEQKLLGRSGAMLAPLLKQVATGFDTASQAATIFGVVVGDKAAAQALQLHQSLEMLESISMGFALRLLTGVSPALQDAASKIIKFATSANGMKTVANIAEGISKTIYGVGNAFVFLVQHAGAVKAILEGIVAVKVASFFIPLIASAATADGALVGMGMAAVAAVGRVSGIGAIARVFVPIIAGAWGTTTALLSLAASEGVAATASYAFSTAFGSIKAALVANPITAILVGSFAVLAGVFHSTLKEAQSLSGGAAQSTDIWTAAINQLTDKYRMLHLAMDKVTGKPLTIDDKSAQDTIAKYGLLGKTMAQATADAAKDRQAAQSKSQADAPKLPDTRPDAPVVPKAASDKTDHLKLKMLELAEAAKAAHQALADAGKGVDFERAGDITKEYTKVIAELDPQLKKLNATQRAAAEAAIKASVTTIVNDNSQAKYKDELDKSTDSLLGQAAAQRILTDAIGKGAAAVRAAQMAAAAAQRDQGKSKDWAAANSGLLKTNDDATQAVKDQSNDTTDKTNLLGITRQIDAQKLLNAAIMQGKEAREQAAQTNEEQSLRNAYADRGDKDKDGSLESQLAMNKELFNIKKQEAALESARAMNPAAVYQEEAMALERVAKAARDAGQAVDTMQLAAASKRSWDEYLSSVDRVNLAVGNLGDGVGTFFRQMARETESAAQQIHDVLSKAFDSINDVLVRMLDGQKNSFAQFFRSISQQLAKIALQKTEAAVAGSITKAIGSGDHTKPTGPASGIMAALTGGNKQGPNPLIALQKTANDYLKMIAEKMTAATGTGTGTTAGAVAPPAGAVGAGLGAITGGLSTSSNSAVGTTASAVRGFLPLLSLIPGMPTGLFGGHFATGGDVTAGMSYDVGEMGRETFTPSVNGRITPNSKLGGGHTINIDARGANDPAQVNAAVHRAMAQYGPLLVKASATSQHDRQRRMPSGSR